MIRLKRFRMRFGNWKFKLLSLGGNWLNVLDWCLSVYSLICVRSS